MVRREFCSSSHREHKNRVLIFFVVNQVEIWFAKIQKSMSSIEASFPASTISEENSFVTSVTTTRLFPSCIFKGSLATASPRVVSIVCPFFLDAAFSACPMKTPNQVVGW